jgi:hypothetical protein
MLPKFTLCYTTIRAASVKTVVSKWMSKAVKSNNVSWSFTTDDNQPLAKEAIKVVCADLEAGGIDVAAEVVTDLPGTCVKGWNLAVEAARRAAIVGDIIIAVADDFEPPVGWDEILIGVAEDEWWKKDRVVHVGDGYNPDIFTLAILTAKRLNRYGYLFYPGYESMFCDTEFTVVAHRDGAVIEATYATFEHLHPDCGKRQRDDADLVHSSQGRYKCGEMLFTYRRSIGFPIDDGPAFDETKVTLKDLAVHIQATKDDFCLFEVCQRLYEEGIRTFFFYVPNQYWSGRIVPQEEYNEVIEIAQKLVVTYADISVHERQFDIQVHRAPGRSRIQVETMARNEAMTWIKSNGFKHIVIADGDELWRRGLLQELLDVINDFKPTCVYTGMVPVAGLPGYPIEGAVDKASIYVNEYAEFQECRGTFGQKYELEGHKIFHFTATRRTMEEIIQKNRESGHYDDPNYDFEGWIKNTLPNIRPGLKNVHMYIPYNPWKEVREWSIDEAKEIPPSLYPYLAVPTNHETQPF